MKKLILMLVLLAAPSSTTSTNLDIGDVIATTNMISFQYGVATGVASYAKTVAGKSGWTACEEATKVLESSDVIGVVKAVRDSKEKEIALLTQEFAIKTARGTFKGLGFNCDYQIGNDWD